MSPFALGALLKQSTCESLSACCCCGRHSIQQACYNSLFSPCPPPPPPPLPAASFWLRRQAQPQVYNKSHESRGRRQRCPCFPLPVGVSSAAGEQVLALAAGNAMRRAQAHCQRDCNKCARVPATRTIAKATAQLLAPISAGGGRRSGRRKCHVGAQIQLPNSGKRGAAS